MLANENDIQLPLQRRFSCWGETRLNPNLGGQSKINRIKLSTNSETINSFDESINKLLDIKRKDPRNQIRISQINSIGTFLKFSNPKPFYTDIDLLTSVNFFIYKSSSSKIFSLTRKQVIINFFSSKPEQINQQFFNE